MLNSHVTDSPTLVAKPDGELGVLGEIRLVQGYVGLAFDMRRGNDGDKTFPGQVCEAGLGIVKAPHKAPFHGRGRRCDQRAPIPHVLPIVVEHFSGIHNIEFLGSQGIHIADH